MTTSGKKRGKAEQSAETITAWKGFNKDLTCTGGGSPFQFKVGETYIHKGAVAACSSGFHACENPLDVWSYYGLENGNRFCRVQLSGKIDRHSGDSKIAAERLTVETEVTLGEMIRAGVEYTVKATKGQGDDPSGHSAQIGSSGDSAQIGSCGHSARIGSSGHSAQIGSCGHSARIGSSGDYAQIGSCGHSAQIGSCGHSARIGSSGHSARIGSSGDYAQIGSCGHSARIGSSGHSARIGSSGHSARIGSSGHSAQIGSSGDYGVIAAAGMNTRAKGADGTWIALPEFAWDVTKGRYLCIGFATGCIGQDGLKADTYYVAKGRKLVEAA